MVEVVCFCDHANHIHLIAQFKEERPLGVVMREFKKHTARQIIRQSQVEGNQNRLGMMKQAARNSDRQEFRVWEVGYDARDIFSADFLEQKMTYLHQNPCQERWGLVERPEDYIWSSARFYLEDKPAIIKVDDVRDLFVG